MGYIAIIEFGPLSTTSNAQRKEELEKWFENVKPGDGHDALHKMLEDPKAKALLDDGYSHLWGDTALEFTVRRVLGGTLSATNPILDLDQSLLPALTHPQKFEQLFSEPKMIDKPIITFRSNYIVDGHHSWIQAMAFNPEQSITILDYDGDLSSSEFFRAIKKAVVAESNNGGKKISETEGQFNLFDDGFTDKDIREYIRKNITKETVDFFIAHIDVCTNRRNTIDWIQENLLRIKFNNCPAKYI